MAPLEPWEKVLVDGETFTDDVHGKIACVQCHAGVRVPDKASAHKGLIPNPSQRPETVCGECHQDIIAEDHSSLHSNLAGFKTTLMQRGASVRNPAIEEMFGNHCAGCHTSCGECHISQPNSVGGGFINGHVFNKTPSMTRNCTACHGSRVGSEYLGKHDGLKADIHFRQGRMNCLDCHSISDVHGQGESCDNCHPGPEDSPIPPAEHRYEGVQSPRCETCHNVVSTGQDDVIMHQMHGSKLSCQVCHSISYTNCDGCHVGISERTGNPVFETEGDYLTFLIGKNPFRSYERPYEYVPVRHVPISQDSFSFYGDNLLDKFNDLETWKYTTPHNIQLETPQTESCNACHGNPDLFLTSDKVYLEELNANLGVIVQTIPPAILSGDQIP